MCLKMLEKSRVTPCVTGYYYTRQPNILIENIEVFSRDRCHANLPGEMAYPKPKRLQILDLFRVTPTSYLVTRPRYVRVTPAPFLIEGGCHAACLSRERSLPSAGPLPSPANLGHGRRNHTGSACQGGRTAPPSPRRRASTTKTAAMDIPLGLARRQICRPDAAGARTIVAAP
jgi:hypothetical protein